jgi:hypothetical protein
MSSAIFKYLTASGRKPLIDHRIWKNAEHYLSDFQYLHDELVSENEKNELDQLISERCQTGLLTYASLDYADFSGLFSYPLKYTPYLDWIRNERKWSWPNDLLNLVKQVSPTVLSGLVLLFVSHFFFQVPPSAAG